MYHIKDATRNTQKVEILPLTWWTNTNRQTDTGIPRAMT